MSPTIVFEDGRPLLALGSPGGASIITTVLQTLLDPTKLRLFPNIRADMLRRIEQGTPIPGLV